MLVLHFITNSAVAIPSICVMLMQREMCTQNEGEKKEFLISICYEEWIESYNAIVTVVLQWREKKTLSIKNYSYLL